MRNVLVWLVLDYVCDGVYILDIAVRLHTGTEKRNQKNDTQSSITKEGTFSWIFVLANTFSI